MQHNIRYRGGWQAPAMCTGQALSVNVYNPPLSSVLLGVTLIRLNGIHHCRVWSASIIKTALDWLATSRAAPGPRLSLLRGYPVSFTSRSIATSFSCAKLRRERQLSHSSAALTRLNAIAGRYFRYREAEICTCVCKHARVRTC